MQHHMVYGWALPGHQMGMRIRHERARGFDSQIAIPNSSRLTQRVHSLRLPVPAINQLEGGENCSRSWSFTT